MTVIHGQHPVAGINLGEDSDQVLDGIFSAEIDKTGDRSLSKMLDGD